MGKFFVAFFFLYPMLAGAFLLDYGVYIRHKSMKAFLVGGLLSIACIMILIPGDSMYVSLPSPLTITFTMDWEEALRE